MANLSVLSRFPSYYMKVYLIGEGSGAITTSFLQTLSFTLGTSTQVSALFYFFTGCVLATVTLIMFYLSKYNNLNNYYINKTQENISKKITSLSETTQMAKRIWSPILGNALALITLATIIPNITSLVVSKNYGSGSKWSGKTFHEYDHK